MAALVNSPLTRSSSLPFQHIVAYYPPPCSSSHSPQICLSCCCTASRNPAACPNHRSPVANFHSCTQAARPAAALAAPDAQAWPWLRARRRRGGGSGEEKLPLPAPGVQGASCPMLQAQMLPMKRTTVSVNSSCGRHSFVTTHYGGSC